jgi:hypothetical protein
MGKMPQAWVRKGLETRKSRKNIQVISIGKQGIYNGVKKN